MERLLAFLMFSIVSLFLMYSGLSVIRKNVVYLRGGLKRSGFRAKLLGVSLIIWGGFMACGTLPIILFDFRGLGILAIWGILIYLLTFILVLLF